ncbi:MFS transporter [Bacillus sp. Au-Bac7]|uniref:MFS transporter n=1 Tax=Bacillus sp. Au-Bac7 TaxID=2906458 RepID=UPI001E4C854F|nr:MFS transporter [Bacillus sp. Au-Bac7]MCE4048875.1 MFS transporter [Bacillus sp. Au-Bac7]
MSKFKNEMSFRFLWLGQMLANLGDVIYTVSLTTIVYKATNSVTLMSLVPFVITIMALCSGFFAPIILDQYKLKWILFYSQSGKTLLLFLLCILIPTIQLDNLILLYILIAFISFLDGCATPARNALVPVLVQKEKLVKTNSFLAVLDQITQLIAWPIGSILLVIWGGNHLLWLTFCLFIISSLFMFYIKQDQQPKNEVIISKWSSIKEGWIIIWENRQLRSISLMNIFETFANGVWIAAILYVYVEEVLHKQEFWWGIINASFFAGMFFGGLIVYRIADKLEKKLGYYIIWSTFLLVILTLAFALISNAWIALIISLLFGFPQMVKDVAEVSIFQKAVRQEALAKVFSARGTLMYAAFGISSVFLGWLTEEFGVVCTFLTATACFLLSFITGIQNRMYLAAKQETLR